MKIALPAAFAILGFRFLALSLPIRTTPLWPLPSAEHDGLQLTAGY